MAISIFANIYLPKQATTVTKCTKNNKKTPLLNDWKYAGFYLFLHFVVPYYSMFYPKKSTILLVDLYSYICYGLRSFLLTLLAVLERQLVKKMNHCKGECIMPRKCENETDPNGIDGYANSKASKQKGKELTAVKQVKVVSVVNPGIGIVAQTRTAILAGGTRRRRIQCPR